VRDVLAVAEAADRGQADDTSRALRELLNLARSRGGEPGAALVREHLPALATTLDTAFSLAGADVQAVEVKTDVGTACRRAVLRAIALQKSTVRDFAARIERTKATWRAVARFKRAMGSLDRSYESEVGECLALARPQERPTIDRLMHAL
jgi:hypothetical protein